MALRSYFYTMKRPYFIYLREFTTGSTAVRVTNPHHTDAVLSASGLVGSRAAILHGVKWLPLDPTNPRRCGPSQHSH